MDKENNRREANDTMSKTYTEKDGEVYLGDSLKIMKKLLDNSIDLVLTDPPYNVAVDSKDVKAIQKWRSSSRNTIIDAEWDKYSDEDFLQFNRDWMEEAYRVLKPKCYLCIWTSYKNIPDIVNIGKSLGLDYRKIFTWAKPNAPLSFPVDLIPSCEYCIVFYKKSDDKAYRKIFVKYILRDYTVMPITSNVERKDGGWHPTIKPTKLMEMFIKKFSYEGHTVLDPFSGSGSILVSAKSNNRKFIGIEISPDYFEIITKRLNSITNNNLESYIK